MPSVEMRRTTRVFGARVLRSGRRLFPTQEVAKHMRRAPLAAPDAQHDWIDLLDHDGVGGDGFKENGWCNSDDGGLRKEIIINSISIESDGEFLTGNRRWGLVYSRKRKRNELTDSGNLDKRFGKKFFRKQSGKKIVTEDLQSSVSPPNIADTEPRLPAKSKSRKKKARRVSESKRRRRNSPNLRPRTSVTIHHGIQKRRSSLRLRKRTNPLSLGNLNSNGGVVQDGVPFFPIKSNTEVSKSVGRPSLKEIKELTQDIDSASCNASILVIESDRCYRETGAVISMEMSSPSHWFLVVKRNGVERLRIEAQNVMRPCFGNRVTRAIMWAGGDESWKLEFPIKQDWFIFRELYRECSERTVRVLDSVASIIPVPQVNEVSGYADEKYVPFKMPGSYITSRGDEVTRILEKSDPVYDMDSGDEEWLNKYNDGRPSRVDEDTFEKIIDAFERGIYCSPEDYSDVTKAVDLCLVLAPKDILEAVYGYWMARRKKAHIALVPAFQSYKPKKCEQLNIKAVLRKKRSFRQRGTGTQAGRGKQMPFLKAALHEKTKTDAAEAENITAKVQETEEAANRAEQEAILKRQRAQLLMEVADLLTYKASIAVKIAEARAAPGSGDDNTIDQRFLPVDSTDFT
ncbi:hypothetical protein M8C21_023580 [Ambrosia artemisiifolia]|uniref:Enhancer of polycomb-like protein n=1 Tax=Ambrosia artemisiifolia TaxID=4212 RepID=A0AAD5GXN2_AMBAR|nr:hypothetical protein M8C21_023580 [Ambrosia artemisiifolia]